MFPCVFFCRHKHEHAHAYVCVWFFHTILQEEERNNNESCPSHHGRLENVLRTRPNKEHNGKPGEVFFLLSRLLSISVEFFKRLPEKRLNRGGRVVGGVGRWANERVNQGRWRIEADRKKEVLRAVIS